jgi:dihydroflavonol-4-reductase
MTERVLVTGITGYIGQHCGAELLNHGYEVVGTIRSKAKGDAAKTAIEAVAPVDKLSFVEADLLSDVGWDDAMQGCTYVLHVASPFFVAPPKDDNELITPAVEGTKRVIGAAQRAGIKRVVLTSSVAAMTSGKVGGPYGPDSWSDTNADIGAYSISKTLAERAAWDLIETDGMELSVINPGAVMGPSLGARIDGQSLSMMADMLNGKMPMIPDLAFGMIDVRDVARLHVEALTAEGAAGKRFVAASAEPVEVMTLAQTLKDTGYKKVSTRKAPKALLKVIGLFDRDVKGLLPGIGKRVTLNNSATFDILGWEPTPIETSVKDMAEAIMQASR